MSIPASIQLVEWVKRRQNTLVGFATVRMPSGIVFHDVSIHNKNSSWWASPASKPMVGRNGTIMRETGGRIKYAPIVSFHSKEVRDRFSHSVIAALRQARPEVFA
jgi:hypothetical protein